MMAHLVEEEEAEEQAEENQIVSRQPNADMNLIRQRESSLMFIMLYLI